ncbi:Hypothetical protein NTJ_04097 [Nesidiocoris tenuis]|uniref:Uncharacterized protein n=1 Tax=Nesidiocoris tenuis TaxID=355587 RepID=A0ABN7AJE5_9HEMI|nr:Hypothetical protein NTJ_04097 [Nesidiocoris tenuis]
MQGSGNAAAIWFVPNTERGVRPDTLTSRRRGERYLRCEELHRLSAPTGIEEPVPPPWPGVRERDGDGKCRRAGGKASTGRGCGTTRGGLATEAVAEGRRAATERGNSAASRSSAPTPATSAPGGRPGPDDISALPSRSTYLAARPAPRRSHLRAPLTYGRKNKLTILITVLLLPASE